MQGYTICSFCGSSDVTLQKSCEMQCNTCKKITFINTATASGCYLIDRTGKVGLAKRAFEPRKGKYDEAGGFVDIVDESCEDAVVREIYEELGITLEHHQIQYLTSHTILYPFQGRNTNVMCVIYYAYISDIQKSRIQCADDVSAFDWFDEAGFTDDLVCSEFQAQQVRKCLSFIYTK